MSELRQLPARLDLVRAPDDDLTLTVSVVGADGSTPVDISAWTLEGEACTATVTDAAGGVFTVVPTGATVGVRAWRVSRTAPDVRSLIAGSDRVSEAADTTAGNLSVDLQLVDGDAVELAVTAGEGSGVVVQDDGVSQGTVGTLNFTGATVNVVGSVATIAISAAGVAALDDLSDVSTAGGSVGDVLTQQADGSFALETPAAGGGLAAEDIDTLAELNAIVTDATLDDSGDSRTPSAHDLAGGLHNAATLAGLNAKISDATLDDASDTRTPASHGDEAHNTAYVASTGDETVAGVKTFTASPIVPAPTTDLQAATKKYVDDNAGGSGTALYLPGVANEDVTMPAPGGLTADLDIRARLDSVDWSLALQVFLAQYDGSSQRAWLFYSTSAAIRFASSSDGTNQNTTVSIARPAAFVAGTPIWVRATYRASDGQVQLMYSLDGASWTVFHTIIIESGGLHDSTGPIRIGTYLTGTAAFQGRVYEAQVRSAIDGPLVANPKFDRPASPRMRDAQGNVWTFNGSAWSWEAL